ncbi:MAG TPA: hypothetical protein VJ927_05605 [Actinomycetota bacterium]|nr:hypothetical protein [Actinomycetota bacterium]
MTRISRKLAAVVGGLLIVVMVPSAAWAPKVFHRISVTGACTAGFGAGTFNGGLDLTHFDVVGDDLTVTGLLSGNCQGSTARVEFTAESVSLAVTFPSSTCEKFSFTVGGSLAVGGVAITMNAVASEIGAPLNGGERLCAVDRQWDAGRLAQAARILNSLI